MTYAIGDIHGCNRTFCALLETLALQAGDRLILLGDYIDRGPDSKGVIDSIFRLRKSGQDVVCLRGNHEQLLLDALKSRQDMEHWLLNGGWQTLASFGVADPQDIPAQYLDFFNSTLLWYETGDYLCVHGGPDFSCSDPLSASGNLLWERRWYADIDYTWLGKRIVLHGHTPEGFGYIQEQHANLEQQQYLNLDNGCVYAGISSRPGTGRLLAFCLETRILIFQTNYE